TPGAGAADLLVGGRQYDDRPPGPRLLEGESRFDNAGFHVVAPRTGHAVAVDPVRKPPQRTVGPHGVVMAEHDDRIGAVAHPDLQVVAGIRPTMPDRRHAEPLPEELRHLVGAGVAARLIRRGGFR